MNNRHASKSRSSEDVISDLVNLTEEGGFIYTFCGLVLSYLWMSPDEAPDTDGWTQPNVQELSFLLGLMVKRPISIDVFPSAQASEDQFNAAVGLLEELQMALNFRGERYETKSDIDNAISWMESGEGMVEPIFYSGDGAYSFQYLEMAERRYHGDKEWLRARLGIEFNEVIAITQQLQQLANNRAPAVAMGSSLEEMYESILSIFTFTPEDIEGFDRTTAKCFLEAFSLTLGAVNETLSAVGDYNAVSSHPVIRLGRERYFLPIFLNLAESVYTSPFYWMLEDPSYSDTGLENRGVATEQIAKEQLFEVFGDGNVFGGVQVKRNGHVVTDIDVLAIAGNKALIVQAKSKKLTALAKQGDDESLRRDFKQAIQEAYGQGLLSRNAVLDKGTSLMDDRGKKITLPEEIDDAYIICLTGDFYPAITIQLGNYLEKNADDPYPVALSIFDLEIVSFYLQDPFDLLYYMRQRTDNAEIIKTESEIALLGFHLREKLYPPENIDFLHVSSEYAQFIDANYPVARGHYEHTETAEELHHQWKNPTFDRIVQEVKMTGRPRFTDALFLLYDLAGTGADNITTAIADRRRLTELDGELHDVSLPIRNQSRGVSFVSFPHLTSTTAAHFNTYAEARKYKAQADEWLVFGAISGSPRAFDMLWYSKVPWHHDAELKKLADTFLKPGTLRYAKGEKVGRNAPCPCGSGVKYKKCRCGLIQLATRTH